MEDNSFHIKIARELGEISAKLEMLPKIEGQLNIINGRVRKNEQEIATIKTKAGLIAGIFGTGVYFLWDFVKSKIL